MTQRQIPIEDATRDQLVKFAKESLGMDFHHSTGLPKISAGIRQAWKPDFILLYGDDEVEGTTVDEVKTGINDDDQVTVDASIRRLVGGSSKGDPKVRLFINEAEGPGGQRPVFVSVNNNAMLLPRGEDIDVPYRYYLALKASITTVYEQETEEPYEVHGRDVPAYPFSLVKLPTEDEMKPWHLQEHLAQYARGCAPSRPDLDFENPEGDEWVREQEAAA